MSEGGRGWRPGQGGSKPPSSAPQDAEFKPGGSVGADRDWARNRIAGFFRGQQLGQQIQRKAVEGAEAGKEKQAEVSQPGQPAEKEADAIADQVADKLHGGEEEGEAKDAQGAEPGKEQAPAIGAKLQPGAISLAKKEDKKQQPPAPQPNRAPPGEVQPVPKTLPAFPNAQKVKPKTPMAGGQMRPRYTDDEFIYEFDRQHGTVEKYDKRGKHLGEFDINTGAQTKPADKTRRVEP